MSVWLIEAGTNNSHEHTLLTLGSKRQWCWVIKSLCSRWQKRLGSACRDDCSECWLCCCQRAEFIIHSPVPLRRPHKERPSTRTQRPWQGHLTPRWRCHARQVTQVRRRLSSLLSTVFLSSPSSRLAMMFIWRFRVKIVRTVLCCVVLCMTVVYTDTHTNVNRRRRKHERRRVASLQ